MSKSAILDTPPPQLLKGFLMGYSHLYPINVHTARELLKSGKHTDLTEEDDYYVAKLWHQFSRKSRADLQHIATGSYGKKPTPLTDQIPHLKCIVDLGCGVGYTPTIFKELFPNASVYGTNTKGAKQYAWCQKMAYENRWELVPDASVIPQKADMVFASNYFQNTEKPVEHLIEIMAKLRPWICVIANAFSGDYVHNLKAVSAVEISTMFNNQMAGMGFKKQKHKCASSRAEIWMNPHGF
jgi:hypothetical protein